MRHEIKFNQHRGAALAVALIMLLVLSLLGTAGIRTSLLEEKMSANMRDSEVSFHSAEAGLREGENWILNLTTEPIPVIACATQPCVISYDSNRYLQDQTEIWWGANSAAMATPVNSAVGSSQYVIEYLRFVSDSSMQIGAGVPQGKHYYRVTTRAVGTSPQAITILKATVARRY
ncbi:MAG: hypothetical protein KIT27_03555 [Legionellales bacterium]|nr:hypothetical protein [Legionellales bacterium]